MQVLIFGDTSVLELISFSRPYTVVPNMLPRDILHDSPSYSTYPSPPKKKITHTHTQIQHDYKLAHMYTDSTQHSEWG